MPDNTDKQAQRRRDAIVSAVFHSCLSALTAILCLYLYLHYAIPGVFGAALLILSIVEFGMLIPIQIALKNRLKEIEGGEEDAAAQY